jgi:oxygen-independent coproporphyrinogen III oxidase
MCDYRADVGAFFSAELTELEADGLIRRRGSAIEVHAEARPLVRAVAAAFDAYLPQSTARHVTAV